MDNQKQELIKKLKDANNILVTVSASPSVDQLAACIGITLFLNKMKKHATAVFSGEVPSTLQFLKPEDTLEKNTDSLRDFIVSLDKSKADKLRYKVEDNIVKIFITPYKTSITEADLDFSQGDFNVDVVLCLGVEKQQDLDQAITAHGRILHDATVASVSIGAAGELGTLNWVEPQASSLSELTYQIANSLDKDQLDGQIATSFLTGIVAETDRFSNEKTSPTTMKLSAELMAAGANQQLVASELQASGELPVASAPVQAEEAVDSGTGTLEIGHAPEVSAEPAQSNDTQLDSAADGEESGISPLLEGDGQTPGPASRLILQPPSMGGTLTANSTPEGFDPSIDPLSLMNSDTPMLNHGAVSSDASSVPSPESETPAATDSADSVVLPTVQPPTDVALDEPVVELPPAPDTTVPAADKLPDFEPLPSEPVPAAVVSPEPLNQEAPEQSLTDLEQAVNSPHVESSNAGTGDDALDAARAAIMDAQSSAPSTGLPQPLQAAGAEGYLNVQDLPDSADEPAQPSLETSEATPVSDVAPLASSPADTPLTMPTPPSLSIPTVDPTPPTSVVNDPAAAPPVPPPLPIDFTPPK